MVTNIVNTPSPAVTRSLAAGERDDGHGVEALNVGRLQT